MDVCLHGNESSTWALSVWPPVSDPSMDLRGQSWQRLCRPCTLMSTWGPVSSAYQKHSLHVSCVSPILSWGLLGWEKAPILTCSLVKMKGDGGLPSPWQRSSTVSPSLTKPWGDSFQSSTMVVGSKHTHTESNEVSLFSELLKSYYKAISTALTAHIEFGSVCHSIPTSLFQRTMDITWWWWYLKLHAVTDNYTVQHLGNALNRLE